MLVQKVVLLFRRKAYENQILNRKHKHAHLSLKVRPYKAACMLNTFTAELVALLIEAL